MTSRFGRLRPDGRRHLGVDLGAPEGTEVLSPGDGVVDAVWTSEEGGLELRIAMKRPDGLGPWQSTAGDDSGFLFTFSHLSQALVKVGEQVNRGEVVALSGNSGTRTTAPHLHVQAEYSHDASLFSMDSNARTVVDPEALWEPGGLQPFDVAAAAGVPGPSAFSGPRGKETPTTIIIKGDGAVQVGNGAAIQAAPVFSIYGNATKGTGVGTMGPPPGQGAAVRSVTDAGGGLFGQAAQASQQGGQIATVASIQAGRGIGVLAGQAVNVATDPNGLPVAVIALGDAVALSGQVLDTAGEFLMAAAIPLSRIPEYGLVLSAGFNLAGLGAKAAAPAYGLFGQAISAGARAVQGFLQQK